MTEFTVDLHNYPEGGSVFRRTAVRGIIERQGKYLLVREKYGDYKFPGGGAEPGETLEETLLREVREETGYTVAAGSLEKWGVVTERRKGQKADIMVMESHYFFCQVEGPAAKQKLDEYEEEHGFCPVWAALPEALPTQGKTRVLLRIRPASVLRQGLPPGRKSNGIPSP